jgi:alpha-beta hydrolase superfamily lysophospholipase
VRQERVDFYEDGRRGDTFAEDLYGYIVPAATKRGYNVLFADLPGQGLLPAAGMPMRYDAEVPFSA